MRSILPGSRRQKRKSAPLFPLQPRMVAMKQPNNNEVLAQGWNDLNDCLYEGDWDERLRRNRPTLVYRGQADMACNLRSAVTQLDGAADVEEHLIRNFRKYARREGPAPASVWLWLA